MCHDQEKSDYHTEKNTLWLICICFLLKWFSFLSFVRQHLLTTQGLSGLGLVTEKATQVESVTTAKDILGNRAGEQESLVGLRGQESLGHQA